MPETDLIVTGIVETTVAAQVIEMVAQLERIGFFRHQIVAGLEVAVEQLRQGVSGAPRQ